MSSSRPSFRRSIEALQHRDYRLLFLSSAVSSIGGQLQIVANTWQLFELTGSAIEIGFIGLARAIPIMLFSLVGGVVADRVERRQIIMATQLLNGAFALFLAIVTITHATQPWHVYLVTFLNASLMSVSAPARRAIIAGLVPKHHLMNALGLNQTLTQTSRILAPSIAGVLIAAFGLGICYFLTAIATLITAAWLTFIHVAPLPDRAKASPLADLSEGLGFAKRQPVILGLLGADMASQLFGSFQVLLPIFAASYGVGAAGYGVLASAPAIGALAGAAVVMSLGDVRYKGYWIIGSILAYCVCLVALAITPWFAMAWIVVAALGFTDAMQSVPRNALIQLVTPDELRGRVSSFQGMVINSGPGLGLGLMGAAAGTIGAPIALVAGAVICAVVNVGILIGRPELRARDLTDEAESTSRVAMGSS